jgi:hypothetical protein
MLACWVGVGKPSVGSGVWVSVYRSGWVGSIVSEAVPGTVVPTPIRDVLVVAVEIDVGGEGMGRMFAELPNNDRI